MAYNNQQGFQNQQGYPGYPSQGHLQQNYPQSYPQQGYPQQQAQGHFQGSSQQGHPQVCPQQNYPLQGYFQGPGYGQQGPGYGQQAGPYNQGPPGQYGGGQGYDPSQDVADLIKATKGFGTDEKALIRVLAKKTPWQIDALVPAFQRTRNHSLQSVITKEVSGNFRDALLLIVAGPLGADVMNVRSALDGAGTKESLLNDVVLGRTNADLNTIKQLYLQRHLHSLEADIESDLSLKTASFFRMVLACNRMDENFSIDPNRVQMDASDLYQATVAKLGTDENLVSSIFATRSAAHLAQVASAFEARYGRKLSAVISSEFSGHLEDALLHVLKLAVNRPVYCAELLEKSMAGAGTKDELLLSRVVRFHWDPALVQQLKGAYHHIYRRDLIERIKSETSGDYERILVAMLN
ncbi:hypothetical protein V1512DRAFT_263663 [Lipomyces arxii]|uniref:uncharacterized protein n=1 Tax=Lipomyces arxii TaxID=56418 RepID=UPI0034CF37CA